MPEKMGRNGDLTEGKNRKCNKKQIYPHHGKGEKITSTPPIRIANDRPITGKNVYAGIGRGEK